MRTITLKITLKDPAGNPISEGEVTVVNNVTGLSTVRYSNDDGGMDPVFPGNTGDLITFTTNGYKFKGSSSPQPEGPGYYRVLAGSDIQELVLTLDYSFNKPSRDQIVNVRANFCNLRDSEDIPIFDGFIDELIINNQGKANDWIRTLKASTATHISLDLSGDYNEYLSWADGRYPIPGHDWTQDLSGFASIIRWVQRKGLIPIIKLGFDGQSYSPDGLTYGWQWGMDNLERIANGLAAFNDSVMWSTGWDGCFPDWSVDQTLQMLRKMRAVLGDKAVISTEFSGPGSIGYIHMGNGPDDWAADKLGIIDNFEIEVNTFPPPTGEAIPIVATRLLGPKATNCSSAPWYLEGLDKPVNICFWENGAYQAIRKQITPNQSNDMQSLAYHYGFRSFGNGQPV